MLKLLKVSGHSLSPAFEEGDFVLIVKIPLFLNPRQGDIVVFQHPPYGTLIKQVEQFDPASDEIYVIGNQPHSVDSRQFGPIHRRNLLGKVIWHFKKPIHT